MQIHETKRNERRRANEKRFGSSPVFGVAVCEGSKSKMPRVIWALVVLWWLRTNPTGLLSPKWFSARAATRTTEHPCRAEKVRFANVKKNSSPSLLRPRAASGSLSFSLLQPHPRKKRGNFVRRLACPTPFLRSRVLTVSSLPSPSSFSSLSKVNSIYAVNFKKVFCV